MALDNYPKELLAQAALKVFHGTAKSVDFLFYRVVRKHLNKWIVRSPCSVSCIEKKVNCWDT